MAFDATLKGESANSYITLEGANTYFGDRLGSTTWDAATDSDKQKALIMATRYLDQLKYMGERTETTQALSFPRQFLPDPDAVAVYYGQTLRLREDYLSKDLIPKRIEYATCELALRLLSDTELLGDPGLRQFKEVEVDGVVRIVLDKQGLSRVVDRNILNFIGPLLRSGDTLSVALRR